MDLLTMFIVAALWATVLSLVLGIAGMVAGHIADQNCTTDLMVARVASQSVAFGLLVFALVTNAG